MRGAGASRMKAEEGVNQRSLTGAVWTEQTNSAAAQIAAQVLKNLPAAKRDAETMKVDYRWLSESRLSVDRFLGNRSGECHTLLIALRPDNSKRIRVRRLYPSTEKP